MGLITCYTNQEELLENGVNNNRYTLWISRWG